MRIYLKSLSEGAKTVDLKVGKITVGRGTLLDVSHVTHLFYRFYDCGTWSSPFTYRLSSMLLTCQCTDKKVSRNHAEIEVTKNGDVFLTSVSHCFIIVIKSFFAGDDDMIFIFFKLRHHI